MIEFSTFWENWIQRDLDNVEREVTRNQLESLHAVISLDHCRESEIASLLVPIVASLEPDNSLYSNRDLIHFYFSELTLKSETDLDRLPESIEGILEDIVVFNGDSEELRRNFESTTDQILGRLQEILNP